MSTEREADPPDRGTEVGAAATGRARRSRILLRRSARRAGRRRATRFRANATPSSPPRCASIPSTSWRSRPPDQGARARADPLRADGGLAVHVLPRRGVDHGRGSGEHADIGAARPALRGRAPVELRHVRLPRTPSGLRHQRLRRDGQRAVGVGREAPGGQRRDRRPRLAPSRTRSGAAAVLAGVREYRTAMRSFAAMTNLEVWYAHIDMDELAAADQGPGRPEARQAARQGPREDAHPRQPAGLHQAHRRRSTASRGS